MHVTAVLLGCGLVAMLIAASCAPGQDGEQTERAASPEPTETPHGRETPTPARSPAVTYVGLSDDGGTVRLAVGETAFLQLPDDRSWTTPAADAEAVMVVPLEAFAGDGSRRWELRALAAGTTMLHTTGTSRCPPDCPGDELAFSVELVVSEGTSTVSDTAVGRRSVG